LKIFYLSYKIVFMIPL